MAGQEVVKSKMDTLKKMLMSEQVYSIIQSVASKAIDPKQLINIAYAATTRNPKLLECNPKSIVHCMVQAAEDGLILEGANQHAHAIPYGGLAVYQVSYRGLLHLLRRAIPNCRNIYTRLVRENDSIEIEDGFAPKFVHRINVKKDRGDVIGAYAIIDIEGWIYPHYEYMIIEELNAVMDKAQKKGGAAWRDSQALPEMQRKTVLKRAIKVMETTPQMAEILNRDNRIESDGVSHSDLNLDAYDIDFENVKEPESQSDKIKSQLPEQMKQEESGNGTNGSQTTIIPDDKLPPEVLECRNEVFGMLDRMYPSGRVGGKNSAVQRKNWLKRFGGNENLDKITDFEKLMELHGLLLKELEAKRVKENAKAEEKLL